MNEVDEDWPAGCCASSPSGRLIEICFRLISAPDSRHSNDLTERVLFEQCLGGFDVRIEAAVVANKKLEISGSGIGQLEQLQCIHKSIDRERCGL